MSNAITQIAALLKQHMGLDIASVGSNLIERGVRDRMARLGQHDIYSYLHVLQSSLGELQELIEMVVVPETWFFRDREAILAMARLVREKIVQAPASRVRILSLPCSTGEEPYSIAMALIDAGVPTSQFRIDAIDICRRSLGLAQRAVYGRNSFRGKHLDYRQRYFTTVPDMPALEQLAEEVQRQVNFRFGNMLEANFLGGEEPYDFIFCRNVLIYFDRDVQVAAVDMLERLLAAQGAIFVGPAEAGLLLRPHLESIGIAMSFGFRRKLALSSLKPAKVLVAPWPAFSTSLPALPLPVRRDAVVAPPMVVETSLVRSTAPAQDAVIASDLLARAHACADRGDLVRAESLCQQHLRNTGPSAAVYYLQGLICDAQQDAGTALQLYRKAIYLQPDHREALLHLAALLAAQGDAAGAERLQQRAQRTRLKSGDKEQSHA
jgi:chemotaxis protein methyltransferase WspC